MTGDNSARRQWWGAVADWRNWRLPVKLAAVLAVPVIVAVGAGVVQIRGYVRAADGYTASRHMVTLRAGLDPLISGVQAERAFSARRGENAGVNERRFKDLTRATDAAAAGVRNLMERATSLGDVASARFLDATVQLDGLPQLRGRVLAGGVDLASAIGGYTVVLRALLDFDQAMVGDFGDPALSGTATALHNLAMADEQMSWQHATVLAGISRGALADDERTALEQSWTRQQDKIADFDAVATPRQQADYRATIAGLPVDTRNSLLQQVRGDPDRIAAVDAEAWHSGSVGTAERFDVVLRGLENQLTEAATRLQDETSDRAGAASVVLLASLFAAGAVGFVVGRNMLRSLRALRVAALDVAQHRLPTLVAQLRDNAAPDVTVEPVPVHTTDELGQLARAFDAVHRQAVSSAAEQAELRTGMRNAFINLSRRSQGLVERQLRLMEELERQEENPEQLANLFKLDNLATRMRRNNENLIVLSGSDVARRFTRPVPLGDVLRAAASEIEQYQRVVVQATPSVEVVGYAAGDLVRLVAELMDNAASFSPPSTQVVVGGRARPGGGVLVDVLDVGVGMSEEDLAVANRKIALAAADDSAELPVARRLGLYVVGRLAGRHGVQVALRDHGEGVRAVVALPADLVRAAPPPGARPAAGPQTSRHAAAPPAFGLPAAPTTPAPTTPAPTTAAPTTPAPVAAAAPNPAPASATPNPAPNAAAPDFPTPATAAPAGPGHHATAAHPAASRESGWTSFQGHTVEPVSSVFNGFVPPDAPSPAPGVPTRSAPGAHGAPADPTGAPPSAPGAPTPATRAPAGPRPGSTWFTGRRNAVEPSRLPPVEQSGHARVPGQGEAPVQENNAELPKRRPRSNLVAERPGAPDAVAPVRRDANATRGFLASYQTGVRQGVRDSGEHRTGRENTT
ncbi:nitrate- and nitrite sensing domain-containing protein [Saccharothrix australiensis]|uniref:histidine kinase n=1 Tax=Saccharothrix australiensis TaxID=2072 RepID=A0A495W5D7_9PSEU|nr:nitrate- and nitrite sensing domain-containing protein [Saccharothrix australiensis]RKT56340.1 signal transduction histidine kinase [Saccharothrix australiensis]